MKNVSDKCLIPYYFISILFGVILAQTKNNIQQKKVAQKDFKPLSLVFGLFTKPPLKGE